ncbi:MAG: SDR family oxidoreductase, partial [Proteobacteria bacterium]|nr:SDR family oxidoreductase [Pseudomonadota bacterium]
MNDFLKVKGLNFLVVGVANKKSVAYEIGRVLTEAGALVFYSVLSEEHRKSVAKILPGAPIFVCNVEKQEEIARLYEEVK